MQASNWAPDHCEALREYLGRGLSFAEAAASINAKFSTDYSRSAAIGRAKRMGLTSAAHPEVRSRVPAKSKKPRRKPKSSRPGLHSSRERSTAEPASVMRPSERAEPVKLRCVGIQPRLLPLVELELGDCRYPYGGDKDGEPIVFCGHPCRPGASYCQPHFDLTRGPGTASERTAGSVKLRLVAAA